MTATPAATAGPVAAIHGHVRTGKTTGCDMRAGEAAAKMAAAKTTTKMSAAETAAMSAAETAAMSAAETAAMSAATVAERHSAACHRRRAERDGCSERNYFVPHRTLSFCRSSQPHARQRLERGFVAETLWRYDQMTRIALQDVNVRHLPKPSYQFSAIAFPSSTSAMRARVPRAVSSGSAFGAKNPCATISLFGSGGAL